MRAQPWVVDGVDGSGKSTLADHVERELRARGVGVAHIRVDDFRRPVAWDAPGLDETRAYMDRYFDFEELDRVVGVALEGGETTHDRFSHDVLTGQVARSFRDVEVCIVEGVMLRRAPRLRSAPGAWLHISMEECVRRVVLRDQQKGRTEEEVMRRLTRRYLPAHRAYVESLDPESLCDVVADNTRWDAPVVRRAAWGRMHPALVDVLMARLRHAHDAGSHRAE